MADVIDVIIAEALGEGPQGMAAVAHVINQRALAEGKTPEQIVNESGQFSGATRPGSSVAASMRDPSIRQQVGEIWSGVQSGQIPNPYPGATHFHTPQVSPSWAQQFSNLGQLGNHIFYNDGSPVATAPAQKRVDPVMPETRPDTSWLAYSNQNATRNQPLAPSLVDAMSFLPNMGVTMRVVSGGQPSSGPNRVGSTRHDHGNAADVDFYRDGRKLDWNNPSDLPILSNIVAHARANGVTGIGAGDDYMGGGRFHVGFGTPSVWGAGGKAANAPEWLRNAYYGTKPPAGAGAPPIMAYSAQRQPTPAAAAAANAARGQQGLGFFGNLVTNVRGALPQVNMPTISPQMQRGALTPLLGTVAGRTALWNAVMPSNIGSAPTITQGHSSGPGTRAYAVTSGGSAPVMLAGSGNGGDNSPQDDGRNPAGQNMDIYRANAAVLGGNGFTQQNINNALASGKTLYKLA